MHQSDISTIISSELHVKPQQVEKTIELLDQGNTVPFIARYRKEVTGSLEDEQIRTIEERTTTLRNLLKRQEEILAAIEGQGKLTPDLRQAIENARKLTELEDLYLPFKQKRRTKAQMAREKGLEPLAVKMLLQKEFRGTVTQIAAAFVNPEKGVDTAEDAIAGARDIIAEMMSEHASLRQELRQRLWHRGILTTEWQEGDDAEEAQTFLMYKDYQEPIHTLPSHRVLAINRGEKKGYLKVHVTWDDEAVLQRIYRRYIKGPSIYKETLEAALADGYKRLLFPALEREVRNELTEQAEAQAIKVFGLNLQQLLLQAPLAGYVVMGLDPGYRTGCKVAVVDATGQVLDHGVIQVTQSDGAKQAAEQTLLGLIKKHGVTLISLGNGTASYETEQFVAGMIQRNHLTKVHYLITSEAGASVYSASKLAKEELPQYDVTIRGAVSIARRVQDPLAELVKIEPKAIGVGQYQHDVDQKALTGTLDGVVETAVNHVGVDLNTASPSLLSHVAGITAATAKNIVAYRNEHGRFTRRKELLKVPRLGPAAFTQCAGFMRIHGGASPLDDTPVHPESYGLAEQILTKLGFGLQDLQDKDKLARLAARRKRVNEEELAAELSAGVPTVHDILDALVAPGRDPRADLPAPMTRQAVVKLSDIQVGTIMRGTVRNITDFGAFVDIGIKTAGLVHISQLSKRHIKHPSEAVSVGDIVTVKVISVDEKRGRIGLTMKGLDKVGSEK